MEIHLTVLLRAERVRLAGRYSRIRVKIYGANAVQSSYEHGLSGGKMALESFLVRNRYLGLALKSIWVFKLL